MPVVPTYDRKISERGHSFLVPLGLADPVQVNIGEATRAEQEQVKLFSQEEAALQRPIQALELYKKAGEQLHGFGEKMLQTTQSIALDEASTNLHAAVQGEIQRIKQDPTIQPAQYREEFDRAVAEKTQQYGQGLIGKYASEYGTRATSVAVRGAVTLDDMAISDAHERQNAALMGMVDQLSKDWPGIGPDEKALRKGSIERSIENAIASKSITPTKAETLRQHVDKTLRIADMQQLIMVNPEQALKDLGDPAKTAGYTTDDIYKLTTTAHAKVNQLKADRHEQAVTEIMGTYSLDQMIGIMNSGKVPKGMDVSALRAAASMKMSAANYMQEQERRGREEQNRAMAKEYADLVAQGDWQGLATAAYGWGQRSGNIQMMQLGLQTAQSGVAPVFNKAAVGQVLDRLHASDLSENELFKTDWATKFLTPVKEGGFGGSPADLDNALREVDKVKGKWGKSEGINYYQEALNKGRALLMGRRPTPGEQEKYYNFVTTLNNQMRNMKDAQGRPLDEHSADLDTIADKLLEKVSWTGRRRYEDLRKQGQEFHSSGKGATGILTQDPSWNPIDPAMPSEASAQLRKDMEAVGLGNDLRSRGLISSAREAGESPKARASAMFTKWGEETGLGGETLTTAARAYGFDGVADAVEQWKRAKESGAIGADEQLTASRLERIISNRKAQKQKRGQ